MQSVLLDPDSLIVSYDPSRGEPRARRGKKKLDLEAAGEIPVLGDCIDCGACVRTCPTGIDIRDGLQMECIACTQCIDACDVIMDNISRPRGLIRYTSEKAITGQTVKTLRPRTLIYLGLIAVILVALVVSVATRNSFDINVGRVTGQPFVELPDGRIANRLRLRVRNQTQATVSYTVDVVDPPEAELQFVGLSPIELGVGEMKRSEVFVILPRHAIPTGRRQTTLQLTFDNGETSVAEYTLLGPQ
jgi:cytochrome c oxidase accessory protein FixG